MIVNGLLHASLHATRTTLLQVHGGEWERERRLKKTLCRDFIGCPELDFNTRKMFVWTLEKLSNNHIIYSPGRMLFSIMTQYPHQSWNYLRSRSNLLRPFDTEALILILLRQRSRKGLEDRRDSKQGIAS
jgi:hypothetical protein